MVDAMIIDEVSGLYRIIALRPFRRTNRVTFDFVPVDMLPRIDAIDRVIHEGNASSPGPVDGIERPWYMHPCQDDNLIVLAGMRHVEIYTPNHGKVESFTVTPQEIIRDGRVIHAGGAMLVWPRNVFHRIQSDVSGSASLNLAVHYEGFDIRTNFNIYGLDIAAGEYRVIREGYLDQSPS